MPAIERLHARQILDSRGNPTVEVECTLDDGSFGRAAVPSGASTGTYEAVELRDADRKRYGGKSVLKAVGNVHEIIAKDFRGMEVEDQRRVDQALLELDGTPDKSTLGANAILGVSMAVCAARAASENVLLFASLAQQYGVQRPHALPVPLLNVLNGGRHADSGLSIQEFMLVPTGFSSFSEALRAGVETYHVLHDLLKERKQVTAVGDEGGFAPRLKANREALELLTQAMEQAGYPGKVKLALDAAASEFFEDGKYRVDGEALSSSELTEYYASLCRSYPIVSIEDSHAEDDWEGFVQMTRVLGERVQVIGDDLFVTNTGRIEEGIKRHAANAALIKLNQIGTVSEAVDALELTLGSGWRAVVSHRSGETEDTFLAHFTVGLAAGQIKTGAPCRSERTAKYNELLRIEEHLGSKAQYRSPFG